MTIPARIATAAAAVVAIALIGAIAFSRVGGVGSPAATPIPTPVPRPSPTPSPIALPTDPGTLTVTTPGTYLAGDPFRVPVTVQVPAGWEGKVGGPNAAFLDRLPEGSGGAGISLTLSQSIYADPCHDRGLLSPQPGPSVDDLATALSKLPGFTSTTPTDVTIDGYSGKQLTLTAPADFSGCSLTPDGYRLWRLPLGGIQAFNEYQSTTLRILDVNGTRLIVSSDSWPTSDPAGRTETQAIVDSIQFQKSS